MAADIVGLNTTVDLLGKVIDTIVGAVPGAAPIYNPLVSVADGALAAAGATGLYANGAKLNAANITSELSSVGRIGSGNSEATRGSIASSKIFGE